MLVHVSSCHCFAKFHATLWPHKLMNSLKAEKFIFLLHNCQYQNKLSFEVVKTIVFSSLSFSQSPEQRFIPQEQPHL